MISDETVERVREAADIVQIIGEHVNLKRTGADFRGPCPFHQGTHRNFSVSPKKGMYYCFVCHESGDVFTFLQKRLGMDWPAAIRHVAEKAGIEVRETDTRRAGPDPREPFWEVNAAAADYFRGLLWEEDSGRQARDYLALRRVSRDVADRFGLGFAPRDAGAMRQHLNALGFSDDRLIEIGLLYLKEESPEPRPRFRNRLIFPILDAVGRNVGFGGRLLGAGEPKYLNSADGPVYSKARLLYGLNMAKHSMRRDDRVVVVEGYFDVARLVSIGIEAVVAPLGTALTDAQAALLRRYTKNAILLYDSDRAGLKATFRAGDELLRHGFAVQVVSLPSGEDPDTFGDKYGADGVLAQLEAGVDVFERKVQELQRAGYFADLRKKRRAIDRLLPTIRAASDPLTRDIYLARTSEVTGVGREVLERETRDSPAEARVPQTQNATPSREQGVSRMSRHEQPGKLRPGGAAERELIRVMLLHRDEIDGIAERVGADDFRDERYREIFSALVGTPDAGDVQALASRLSTDAAKEMQELLADPDAIVDARRTVNGSIGALRVRELSRTLRDIDKTLPIAAVDEKDGLIADKMRIMLEIKDLKGVGFRHFGKSRTQGG